MYSHVTDEESEEIKFESGDFVSSYLTTFREFL